DLIRIFNGILTRSWAVMKRLWSVLVLSLMAMVLLVACGSAGESGAVGEGGEVRDFVTWYQYDQNNEDPVSDERVGNEYLRRTIPLFNEEFAGKWNWINQPKAFDKMATELITAVQAAGE